ncbi:sensor histidine kinase [Microbacterium sp. MYb64]|uniref:sensor histidine kinase n=1 Tax=Microbacterium sp. MYb64 TaxID=1848691 RepID=UPI000CFB3E15|nr:ATP-binding protein [Microbacterium sp. MYb64]PRB05386.1 ATP-binding protein [Microbacterium sp. MYb64]
MSADQGLREAWEKIPTPGEVGQELERFAGRRMERIIAIVVGVGALALGTQALVTALVTLQVVDASHLAMMAVVFVPWLAMLVCCTLGRGVRLTAGIFFVAYLIDLLLWPFVATHKNVVPTEQPWIFFLVNVAGVAAVVAFPLGVQVAWALVGPFIYGTVRLMQGDFGPDFWIVTAFDVSFTLILGLVLVALGWMFRSVANGVDDARGRAVALYTEAASAEAVEHERVAVAALMHDSVLAALIAAERAGTDRERALAMDMAREALTRLANAEAPAQEGSDEPVEVALLAEDLRHAVTQMGLTIEVEQFGHGAVPDRVARAMALAARQAIGNAVAHASARGLAVVVEGHGDTGLTVKVSDTGSGFDPSQVGADRLGIRASILARMTAVGGSATIDSDRHGTVVTLGWSRI